MTQHTHTNWDAHGNRSVRRGRTPRRVHFLRSLRSLSCGLAEHREAFGFAQSRRVHAECKDSTTGGFASERERTITEFDDEREAFADKAAT